MDHDKVQGVPPAGSLLLQPAGLAGSVKVPGGAIRVVFTCLATAPFPWPPFSRAHKLMQGQLETCRKLLNKFKNPQTLKTFHPPRRTYTA